MTARGLVHAPDAPVVVLSPHFDDAALSCWTLLARDDVDTVVVNVFAGVPERGVLGDWDRSTTSRRVDRRLAGRLHGRWPTRSRHSDSAHQMAKRIAEDRRALAGLGRVAVNLELLEAQYRVDPVHALSDPTPKEIAVELARRVPRASGLVVPAGLGADPADPSAAAHVDHVLVRSILPEFASFEGSVQLYADLPYAARRGWPDWVEGSAGSPDVTAAWAASLRSAGIEPSQLEPTARRLSTKEIARKRQTLHRYKTQRRALDCRDEKLAFELLWLMRRARPQGTAEAGSRGAA